MEPRVNKQLVMRHFSLHAGDYDGVTPVQAALGKDLLDAVIDQLPYEPTTILELGCGTGRLTQQALQAWPEAQIIAIDLSEDMIELARDAVDDDPRVMFIVGDAEELLEVIADEAPFDLIISNAMVQWLEHPTHCLQSYFKLLNDEGVIGVSAFGERTFHELQASFFLAEEAAGMPHASHVMPLPQLKDLRKALAGNQSTITCREEDLVVPYPDVRALLRNIRQTGANLALTHRRNPVNRKVFQQLDAIYAHTFPAPGGGIEATYHTLIAVATRGSSE